MSISEEEHQKRLKFYNKGLNDREIAEKVGLCKDGIRYWRNRNGLSAHHKRNKRLSKKEHKKRMVLYKKGLSDSEIAEKIGLSRGGIKHWRKSNNLTANNSVGQKISNKEHKKRLKLYNKGLNDKEIAKKKEVSSQVIQVWRNKNNLPAHNNYKLTKKEHKKRLKLYNKGLNDKEIAKKIELTKTTIQHWRNENNLVPNGGYDKIPQKTKDEIEDYYYLGFNDREIAQKLDISISVVSMYRYTHKLPAHNPKNNGLNLSEHQKRLKLYNKGLTDRKIAEKVGLSRAGIFAWRKRNNLPSNYKNKKG